MAEPDLWNLDGPPPPPPPPQAASAPDATGGDPAVWTLLGEAGADPRGQIAAASTIVNRSQRYGKTPEEIVADPGQGYEAWNDPSARAATIQRYPVGSPAYNAAAATLQGMQSGDIPNPGYTHFYGPQAQAGDGRAPPAWSVGQNGTDIGGNRYYTLPGQLGVASGEPDLWNLAPVPNAKYDPTAPNSPAGPNPPRPPDPQASTFGFLAAHGFRDENAPLGSSQNPAGQLLGKGVPSEQGSWYVTPDGKLLRTGDSTPDYMPMYQQLASRQFGMRNQSGADRLFSLDGLSPNSNAAPGGFVQGLYDVGASVNKFLGGGMAVQDPMMTALGQTQGGPSAFDISQASLQGAQQERNRYDLLRAGDPAAAGGRFFGQSVPITAATLGTGEGLAGLGPAGEFLAGRGAGNLFAQSASRVAGGALQGAEAGALTSATSDRPVLPQMATGAALGGALAAAEPVVASGAQRMITGAPLPSGPVTDLAATAMNKWGIPLRAGQIRGALGDRAANYADSNLLGSSPSFAANNQTQRQAWMRGVTGSYGDPSGDVSPSSMQQAKDSLGDIFDRVAANTTISNRTVHPGSNMGAVDTLQTHLGSIIKDAQDVLPDNEVAPLLRQVQSIGDAVNNGELSGASYQALTRKGAPLDRAMSSADPNVAHYAGQIRDALDDALEASASPSDVDALRQARFQYKNLMTVAKLAPKADANGVISPALLRGAVNTNFKNAAFQGAGNLGELAQIGQTFMKEPPSSGTAERARAMLGPFGTALALGGEAAGTLYHHPEAGAATLAAVLGANAAKKGLSALQEAKLGPAAGNRLINPPPSSPAIIPYVLPSAVVGGNRFIPQPPNP